MLNSIKGLLLPFTILVILISFIGALVFIPLYIDEISIDQYERIEKMAKEYPKLSDCVYKAMKNYKINSIEYYDISKRYYNIKILEAKEKLMKE